MEVLVGGVEEDRAELISNPLQNRLINALELCRGVLPRQFFNGWN